MQKISENDISRYEERIRNILSSKKATLGFDGFIDSIVKVIRQRSSPSDTYFESSRDFAQYILEKKNKNFSIELKEQTLKLGGNMPIMANALARLGPQLSCIGALGMPKIHPAFHKLPQNCTLYSIAEPGISTALEFLDNKIMMADMKEVDSVDWSLLKEIIGTKELIELFSHRDLFCLLNWSELLFSTSIWKGLLEEVLPFTATTTPPIGFFDLSDCSRRDDKEIAEALSLLKAFSKYWRVTLGLNLNEADRVYDVLVKNRNQALDVWEKGQHIYESLGIQNLVIHCASKAVAWDDQGKHSWSNTLISTPKVLTGAGDNFNAGFCLGLLLGLGGTECLELAHTVSKYYLLNGESPTLQQLNTILNRPLLVGEIH